MSAPPTIGKMLRNRDETVVLHCTFAVGSGAAIVAEGPVARAAMHCGLIFTLTNVTRKRSTCCCGWKQLERDCIFKQFVRGFGAHLCAARACKCAIRARIRQLHRTPTAGLVKAWVNLHKRARQRNVREWSEKQKIGSGLGCNRSRRKHAAPQWIRTTGRRACGSRWYGCWQ